MNKEDLNIFSGNIIVPGDVVYTTLKNTYSHNGNPAVILQPKNTIDVQSAVNYARNNKLVLSVRSGGHGGAGFATNEKGVVIDLSLMNKVEIIDKNKGMVRISGGAVWGDIAETLQQHNLAISSGDTKSVGVGGLTLGGGIGWMVRKFGLALDSLVGAEIVTADGKILHLSETENRDLFWAIRGAGSNFGVVTYFEFKAHTINKTFFGTYIYSNDNLKKLLTGWRDYMRTAPEEVNSTLLVMPSFGDKPPSAIIMVCILAEDENSVKKLVEPLTSIGKLLHQDLKEKAYADILEEAHKPEGVKIVGHNAFVKEFNNEVITLLSETHGQTTSPMLMLRSIGGAMNRIDKNATAFAHRDSEIFLVSVGFVPLNGPQSITDEIIRIWKLVKAHTNGVYVNFMMDSVEEEIAGAYPKETYERLSKLKKQYDPENLFNQNYNIKTI